MGQKVGRGVALALFGDWLGRSDLHANLTDVYFNSQIHFTHCSTSCFSPGEKTDLHDLYAIPRLESNAKAKRRDRVVQMAVVPHIRPERKENVALL